MRHALSDAEWGAVQRVLPNKPRGVPRVDDRRSGWRGSHAPGSLDHSGFVLMPETRYRPTNKYLPPRPRKIEPGFMGASETLEQAPGSGFLAWLDWALGD